MFDIAILDSTMSSVQDTYTGEDALLELINPQFDALRAKLDIDLAGYCIDRFCEAEVDFTTAGNRGMGRISDHVPRYGAYFRKYLSRMPATGIGRAKEIIEQHVVAGYLTHALLTEDPLLASKFDSGESLLERWIPGIYSGDPGEMGEVLRQSLSAFDAPTYTAHQVFRQKHRMKGGGFFSDDKSDLIVAYYPLAGFGLRATETGKWG